MNFTNYFWEPIKIEQPNVWFWSDLHIGHKCEHWEIPLWKNRGFDSVQEHDANLISRWNSNIKSTSTVFHLGDIMFGPNGAERLHSLLCQLNFDTLYLLGGNHHAGFKQLLYNSYSKSGVRTVEIENKTIYVCPNYIEAVVCGQPIVVSHYPLASWNGQAKGSWMIHGHCHGNLYKSELGKILYSCKITDVGVELCPKPKSFEELRKQFAEKQSKTFDHHTQQTLNPF